MYEVSICAQTYEFPFVHIHVLLRPMSAMGKLKEDNAKTKTCGGQGHSSSLDKLYFAHK